MDASLEQGLSVNLANNLKYLRAQRGATQAKLAKQAGIPRSTLATLEVGEGNPTLNVLARLSLALQVSIEELLSTPRAQCQLFPKGSLKSKIRSHGRAELASLLPDPIPGMEFDRLRLAPGANLAGAPHRPGTREYLCCEKGEIKLWAAGEKLTLKEGDVGAFQGDQKHTYRNEGKRVAIGYSVVVLVPISVGISNDPSN